MSLKPRYKRILLKISGEALLGKRDYGIDFLAVKKIAQEIKQIHDLGVQVGLVIGAGNIFRGIAGEKHGFTRTTGDYMGMLGTIINSLALQDAFEKFNLPVRTHSAITMQEIAEPYIYKRARHQLEKGNVIILSGGSGIPYMTTDTCAVIRALELDCQVLLKATKVDGVYEKDPLKFKNAKKFNHLPLSQALKFDEVKVMDNSALAIAADNQLSIIVFDFFKSGNLKKVVLGEKLGTLIN